MVTFVLFVVLAGLFAALVIFSGRLPAVDRILAAAGRALAAPALALCRAASAATDFFLRPRGSRRRVSALAYALWAGFSLLPMIAFFGLTFFAPALPVDAGYLLLIGALFPVFVVGAAYLIVHDDFDVMDGVVDGDARRVRGGRSATRPTAIAISVVLVAAYAVAIAWWLAEVEGFALFAVRPHTGSGFIDYVLVGLRALPTDFVLSLLDRLTGEDTSVTFAGGLVPQAYFFSVKGVGSVLLVGLITIAIQEAWQLRRIVTEIGESDERSEYLIERALRAPPVVKRGILRAAVTPSTFEKQKRLIVAAKEIGIFTLPATFCHNIELFDSEIQVFGLDQCLEMFRHRSREFDTEQCDAILRKAAHVFRRGKLAVEPMKKLLRLMASVLIVKRGVVTVTDPVRGMLAATVRKEMDKPRAKDDPALRGFLRDLQGALNGPVAPIAAAPAAVRVPAVLQQSREDWIKRPLPEADPASPPDSPAPTVH